MFSVSDLFYDGYEQKYSKEAHLSNENSCFYLQNFQNQFFISGLAGDEIIHNRVADAIYRRIRRAHKENKCFRVIIVIPLLPGFQVGIFSSRWRL